MNPKTLPPPEAPKMLGNTVIAQIQLLIGGNVKGKLKVWAR